MIVFNHNIHFPDERNLEDQRYNPELESIKIIASNPQKARKPLLPISEWLPMSGRKARYSAEREFSSHIPNEHWSLEVEGVASLTWHRSDQVITYIPDTQFTPERLRFWVLHTMLPFILTLEGKMDILHVGCVEIEGRPVIFSADSFGGKSTLTDCFVKRGHSFLSDDSLGIRRHGNRFDAIPSYPFHRPYRDPEELGYPVTNISDGPKPIHAVYRLEKTDAKAPVSITVKSGVERFMAFHSSRFVRLDFLKQQHFELMSAMAQSIPGYTLQVPWDIQRLPEVHKAIVRHSNRLTAELRPTEANG